MLRVYHIHGNIILIFKGLKANLKGFCDIFVTDHQVEYIISLTASF